MTQIGAWQTISLEEAGFAAAVGDWFDVARQAGTLPNVHAVVAVRHGRICFERYLAGPDAGLGRSLGIVRFQPDTLHDMRSVTKSIVGLLYGIALAAGDVPPPEAPLLAQFPEYPELAQDPARQGLTIAHTLTMTLGIDWDEMSIPYGDPRNCETAMNNAADGCRYVLERPIIGSPGVQWSYSGGATALLGRLIAKGTGRSLPEFAQAALFAPLGIARAEWRYAADGQAVAASGLRLTPRDLARIGVAMLEDGRQVIPADWLVRSLVPAVSLPDGRRYGFHWYLAQMPMDDGAGDVRLEPVIQAVGNGGQRLYLLPRLDLVVAITAGNYGATDQGRPPLTILRDVLLPALRA